MAANIPLLDAAIAEILRCARTATAAARIAKTDAVVLGHHIPKGSQIMCSTEGEQFLHSPIQVDESRRSETSRKIKDNYKCWDSEDKQHFKPERWLQDTGDKGGDVEFNANAGPSLTFGGGPRGCFGTCNCLHCSVEYVRCVEATKTDSDFSNSRQKACVYGTADYDSAPATRF